jgi:hypothetical protein
MRTFIDRKLARKEESCVMYPYYLDVPQEVSVCPQRSHRRCPPCPLDEHLQEILRELLERCREVGHGCRCSIISSLFSLFRVY